MKNTTEWKQILAGQYEKMGRFEKVFNKIKCFFEFHDFLLCWDQDSAPEGYEIFECVRPNCYETKILKKEP
jgi:hypothetical protein